jgi:hypothetical protein
MTPEQARSAIVSARSIARVAYADDATKWWAELTAPEIYYHGGPRGLQVGDFLLPATVTGASTTIDRMPQPEMPASWEPSYHQEIARMRQRENQRVFVTKRLLYATQIAALHHPAGTVYRVEPLDNLADRTLFGHSETTCDRARILVVVMEDVTSKQFIRLQEEHARRKAQR